MTLFASILHGVGLSQAEAADYLNVSLDTVGSWTRGRRNPNEGVLAELRHLAQRQQTAASAGDTCREDWPCEGAYLAVQRRAWELV